MKAAYPGFPGGEDEIKAFAEAQRAKGNPNFKLPPPSTPSFSSKYKPKRSVDEEIAHQAGNLEDAEHQLNKSKPGTKLWRAKKIRVAVVSRFLRLANEKKMKAISPAQQQSKQSPKK